MKSLRDWLCRTAFGNYFENLDTIDRATFWIVSGLALAIGLSGSVLIHRSEPASVEPDRWIVQEGERTADARP